MSHAPTVDIDRAPPGVLLAEIGWEVCNPVGGIYQVLRSKAPTMVNRWAKSLPHGWALYGAVQ